MGHIELARWADLVLIAPATADLMARLAQGIADDLLSTLVLATDAPVALAPAMNQAMWRDPATQANAATARRTRRAPVRPGRRQPGLWRCRPRAHARSRRAGPALPPTVSSAGC